MRAPYIHIVNLGCSKNLVDTERIYGDFLSAGFRMAEHPDLANLVVVNTCGFIEAAKEESVNEVLERIAHRKRGQKVVVAGCLSQRYKQDLSMEIPEVDLWAGTYKPGELVAMVKEAGWKMLPECSTVERIPRVLTTASHYAYVKVSEGCDRVCSFCAIPGIRGKHESRTADEVVQEIRDLSSEGVKEAILIAQDLTYWGRDLGKGKSLSGLLKRILSETDIEWLRLTYAYPQFVDDSLLELMATESRICSYLDMPLQHGSERMLKAMRRGHTREGLRELLSRIRSAVPGIALRTTFLVGFPGETEDDFKELMELVEENRFDRLGGFTYSPEEGTHGFTLPDPVDPDLAQDRLSRLMARQSEISLELNEAKVGRTLRVLVDEVAEGRSHRFDARTEHDAPEVDNSVQILDGDAEPGTFVQVKVVGATEYDLEAVVVE
ncbi:MAG TPA: 30S ribosomal protein S12 methylthiotransferase RimO [Fibrobacteria bacterium]|nr:30S ribosomal protein S12 methylthiotransferase RimO [Fibrobacteria bacterium]HOX52785.1 30S ribosomal protein S12 methylthiotransferase RimO [Fibrobacteria bacterium]